MAPPRAPLHIDWSWIDLETTTTGRRRAVNANPCEGIGCAPSEEYLPRQRWLSASRDTFTPQGTPQWQ
jgi:hypothetical protein